jgi:hypothetical protein
MPTRIVISLSGLVDYMAGHGASARTWRVPSTNPSWGVAAGKTGFEDLPVCICAQAHSSVDLTLRCQFPLPFTLSTRAASPDYESMNSNLVLRGDFHV